MKKYFYIVLFSLFLVFTPNIVSAKNVGINYDANEHFNYFYEQINSTPFYQFLVTKGSSLGTYLNSITPNVYGFSTTSLYTYIYYADDLAPFVSSTSSQQIPTNSKYVIVIPNTDARIHYDAPTYMASGDNYYLDYYLSNESHVLYFYDENANYISSALSTGQNSITFENSIINTYDLGGRTDIDMSNFTYFISSFYNSSSEIFRSMSNTHNAETLIVTDLRLDGELYVIDDNANYGNFASAIRRFFSFGNIAGTFNAVDSSLEYFKLNKYKEINGSIKSLYEIINYYNDSSISLPANYVSQVVGSDGGFLIPKVTTSNSSDVYLSSNGPVNLFLSYWEINDDSSLSYMGNNKRILQTIKQTDIVGHFDLLSNSEWTPLTFSDYVYQIGYQGGTQRKYEVIIYYNPDTYGYANFNNQQNITATIPSGNSLTITPSDVENSMYAGASVNIFTTPASEQRVLAAQYSELWTSNSFSLLSRTMDFLASFGIIISSLFSMAMVLFNVLPIEIRDLFMFMFLGGVVILVLKIIRG